MAKISDLSDELLVKILSFLPTKVAVSTSVISKQWEFLWMWLSKLEFDDYYGISSSSQSYRDFIAKNLPLHRAPIIESLHLKFFHRSVQHEDIKSWAGIAVSRCVRELIIDCHPSRKETAILLPISLYTCKTLVTLKLRGNILVDVPPMVCLPSLKTLHLQSVSYSNEDSLKLLLSRCPVLEDLNIERDNNNNDNVGVLTVFVRSLLRLSLSTEGDCSFDGYVINTPSLKYFKVMDYRETFSYVIEHMPELEEAEIVVHQNPEEFLESITSVKLLTLQVFSNADVETVDPHDIVFNQLENLKLCICDDYWSRSLFRLLKDSPKLRVLNLDVDSYSDFGEYEPVSGSNNRSSVPKCLLKSLETFEFAGYKGRPEERDFLSFIFKHARRLKSSSILR